MSILPPGAAGSCYIVAHSYRSSFQRMLLMFVVGLRSVDGGCHSVIVFLFIPRGKGCFVQQEIEIPFEKVSLGIISCIVEIFL